MSALSDGPPPPTANQDGRPTVDHQGPGQRQAQSQGSGRPRNRGHRGRGGRGAASGASSATEQATQATQHAAAPPSLPFVNPAAPTFNPLVTKPSAAPDAAEDGGDADTEVCFICANPIGHISIAPCNHSTCHICGLRMRALYKDNNCAHCRVCDLFWPLRFLYGATLFIVPSG
jgi:E3 ubiquitin-protein ligase ZNF598